MQGEHKKTDMLRPSGADPIMEGEHSEVTLAESEKSFRALTEAAFEGFCISENDRVCVVNDQLVDMLGYPREELIGKSVVELVPSESRAMVTEAFHGDQDAAYEHQMRRKDGSDFHVESQTRKVQIKNRVLHLTAVRDISERKQAESDLKLFRELIDRSNNGIHVVDPATARFLDVNECVCRDLGYTRDEMLALTVFDVVVGLDWSEYHAQVERLRKAGHAHLEAPHRRKDGTVFLAEVNLSFASLDRDYLVVITRDITERQQAAAALKESEERLRLLAEAAFVGICISENGRVCDINNQFLKMFGYERDELIGKAVLELVAPESRQKVMEAISGGREVAYECQVLRKDGTFFYTEIRAKTVQVGGKMLRMSALSDITGRKREAAALAQSEEKYRCLFESSREAIMTLDGPAWRFTSANPAAVTMFRAKSEADLLTHAPWELSPERQPDGLDSDAKAQMMIVKALSEGSHFFEWTHRRLDGQEFPATVHLSTMQAGGKLSLQGTVRDVTQSRALEGLLRLQSGALEAAANAIVITDTKGVIQWANVAFSTLTGYDPGEVMGNTPRVLKSGKHDEKYYQNLWETVAGGKVWKGEMINRRKDGTLYDEEMTITPVKEVNGEITHFIAVKQDITERKRAEARITEQAELLDKAQDAIHVRDLEGRILFWNKGAERIYGWTREEAEGRNISKIIPHDPKLLNEINGLTMSRGEWYGEIEQLAKDQRKLTVEVRSTLIRDPEGHPKSVLSINTDVTEKKKIEAQFMRAQRMESLGTLAGGIAHDLNNILAPILMSIDLLRMLAENPQISGVLDTIETSAKRGTEIVGQVLSFARGLEGRQIEVQPKHLVKELATIIKDTFPKDIRLNFSLPNQTWTILGDPTHIHQILLNLCVNARDAMPGGGNLAIGIENFVVDEQYAGMNPEARTGRYVKITVADSGTGISADIVDKIFDPFFTTKEVTKGTGLGLSTVMAVVKSHRGFIDVDSEPGHGTSFKVFLPAMQKSSGELEKQTQALKLPLGNGETVLVVDDEASILEITSRTLQAHGYRVLTATNGAEGVASFAQHAKDIAVVLSDMMMPIMDGPAMIHALKRMNPGINIIASSGLNEPGSTHHAAMAMAGVKHFLIKPFTARTLLTTMRTILDEKPKA